MSPKRPHLVLSFSSFPPILAISPLFLLPGIIIVIAIVIKAHID